MSKYVKEEMIACCKTGATSWLAETGQCGHIGGHVHSENFHRHTYTTYIYNIKTLLENWRNLHAYSIIYGINIL